VIAALREAGEQPHVIGEITLPSGERSTAKGKGNAWAVQYSDTLRL
jgi:phosphoribosylformylglycinamidine cyclo-ligase